jgi:hypothetical protein
MEAGGEFGVGVVEAERRGGVLGHGVDFKEALLF